MEQAFANFHACEGKSTAILMIITKGKGVSYMENSVDWYGKVPNDTEYKIAMDELNWRWSNERHPKIATRESYGNALVALAKEYSNLVVLDADLVAATKTGICKKVFQESHFDCGIQEANMMAVVAGMRILS